MSTRDSAEGALRAHVTSVKEDLMTGVSYMIPFVTIGGIFLALGYALVNLPFFPGTTETISEQAGTIPWYLAEIGGLGLSVIAPILGAYIAYAIADRPGLAPGFILSYALQQEGLIAEAGATVGFGAGEASAGFLGALVAGLLAGYVARWFKNLSVPRVLEPMMPVLIIPVLTTMVLAPVMLFVLGVPIALAYQELTTFLTSMRGQNAFIVGLILGAMMAFDMGGPVNKVAYVFAVGLISADPQPITGPMAAVMIAGMTPPIGLALSNLVAPQKYDAELYENAVSAIPLGFSFITEGAIPYAAADPVRIIPSAMAGSAVGAGVAMALGVTMPAPHGGIFVFFLSNRPLVFLGCIVLGAVVTAVVATAIKPDYEVTVGSESAQSSD
ncbi:PTS fructose transporter subunit IIC [Halegenticoccus tardaugens]|uniref:PTS fructose transporter subunit IIC n=1 Tax=Halegenticoccus tardaugens TaxID=2071624 RepID=UPI00100C111D|nr:PTS fructose transporter subunit IIC [Halegenticoccus tardaugens]